MKQSPRFLLVLTAVFFTHARLLAETADWSAQLDQIRELIKPVESDTPAAKNVKAMLKRYPDMWQKMLEGGQTDRMGELEISGMGGELAAVPGLEAKVTAFNQSVKAEIDRRDAAKVADIEALLARVGATLQSAKKPEDLDALMLSLGRTKISEYNRNTKLSALSRDLQNSLQIVSNWQEYLMAVETGNAAEIRNNLQQISSQLTSTPIVPRSLVLRLLNPRAPDAKAESPDKPRISVDGIVAKLTESGDCAAAIEELKAMPGTQQANSNERSMLAAIQAVEDLRKQEPILTEAEVFANIRSHQQSSHNLGRYSLARAIDQIALNAISRSYAIEPLSSKTTSPRKTLDAMAVTAIQKEDWPKLKQIISSLDDLNAGNYNSAGRTDSQKRAADLKIMSLLDLGQVAEQRNDLEAAAMAYIEAAALDGQYLQRVVGYQKLAALKEKSPDKVAVWMAKAEENRQRTDAARLAAELEMRNRSMMYQPGMANARFSKEDLKPMIQEVVAEFLKEKRADSPIPAASKASPKKKAQ